MRFGQLDFLAAGGLVTTRADAHKVLTVAPVPRQVTDTVEVVVVESGCDGRLERQLEPEGGASDKLGQVRRGEDFGVASVPGTQEGNGVCVQSCAEEARIAVGKADVRSTFPKTITKNASFRQRFRRRATRVHRTGAAKQSQAISSNLKVP